MIYQIVWMWALLECMPTTLMLPFLQLLYLILSLKSIAIWNIFWLKANKWSLNTAKTEFTVISSRQKVQSLNDYTRNIHVDGVPINQSNQSKPLGLIIDENLSWKSLKKYPLASVLLSGSGHLFQCTLQLKCTKVLLSHTSIIAALYEMAWPNSAGQQRSEKLQKL